MEFCRTFRNFKQGYYKLLLFLAACMLPMAANSGTEEVVLEKRIGVAMRMIGHEILLSLGDCESRILPIENIDGHYKIPFEFEFGFDPDDIVSIISRVMTETNISTSYLVEVQRCETNEVVHSFEVRTDPNSNIIPCRGRMLPIDCYSLLITFLDGTGNFLAVTSDSPADSNGRPSEKLSSGGSPFSFSAPEDSNLFTSVLLIIPILFVIGIIGFFISKKYAAGSDPNLILL